MIVGALLEVVSLGAVIPFLAFVSAPERAWTYLDRFGIDSVFGQTDPATVTYLLGAAFVVLSIAAALFRTALGWAMNRYVFSVGRHLSYSLLSTTLHQPYSYHLARNTSETISTIQEVRSIAISVLQPVMQVATSLVAGLFIVISLVLINPLVATTAFVTIAAAYLLISALLRRRIGTNAKVMETLRSRRIQTAQEALGGIRDVLLDSSQKVFIDQFTALDRRISTAQASNNFASTAPRYSVEALGMVLITLCALYFSTQPGGIPAALPTLAALALGAQRLLPLIQQGYQSAVQASTYSGLAGNLLRILEAAPPEEYRGPPPKERLPLRQAIAFHDVSFRYQSGHRDVIKGLDLVIPKGARVGIIGTTGSGKSTAVDLLMGLLQPTSGEITVDGVVLDKTNRRAWHKAVAHVPQAIYLSDASLAANIAFGSRPEDIDMAAVERAARQAELADFIASLPEGYDTGVGERGVRLSGGQRQRVGIARALYKSPSILILDEGTSALDNDTEAAVMRSIEALDRDLTIVMVAHRLSTIAGCDFAVRLENGAVVERLEPAQLRGLRVAALPSV
jgi:ABC-type bacteriocin/lantibiotic exporter with double-glycine peptidase domain